MLGSVFHEPSLTLGPYSTSNAVRVMVASAERSYTEESTSGLFGPEIVLPEQFSERVNLKRSERGEKRLMLAVLEEAVATYQRNVDSRSRHGERVFREAEDWIRSGDTAWPFAFENICHSLEIEPEFLRGGLERWKKEQLKASGRGARVYRFPFRRVNGRRSSISLRSHAARAALG
jgi:hypothetical protein